MTLQPEIYAQTSQIFQGRVTLLRVISYIQVRQGYVPDYYRSVFKLFTWDWYVMCHTLAGWPGVEV